MAEDDVEPLVTECPKCQTRFRVTENQLKIAAGRVRCGACLTVFQGVEHLLWDEEPQFSNDAEAQLALDQLLEELDDNAPEIKQDDAQDSAQGGAQEQLQRDEDTEAELPDLAAVGNDPISVVDDPDDEWWGLGHQLYGGHEEPSELAPEELERIEKTLSGVDPANAEVEVEEPATDQIAEPGGAQGAQEAVQEIMVEAVDDLTTDAVEGAPASAPASALAGSPETPAAKQLFVFGQEPTERRWWVTVATAFAVAALVVQLLWYQFETWARDPTIRPVYVVICQVLGCALPIRRDVERMVATSLIVRSHPEVANGLLVDAIIVNQAAFVQPFPVLELRFTSMNGNLVAGRRFQPREYLAGELAGATLMQMQTPIHVELAIEDPGDEAVNYFLSFH